MQLDIAETCQFRSLRAQCSWQEVLLRLRLNPDGWISLQSPPLNLCFRLPSARKGANLEAPSIGHTPRCESPRSRRLWRGLSFHRSSPTLNPAQFACLGCVFAGCVILAPDHVAHFALRLRQQPDHDEPSLRRMAQVGDILSNLELGHSPPVTQRHPYTAPSPCSHVAERIAAMSGTCDNDDTIWMPVPIQHFMGSPRVR
jgi:hypothetical protein